MTAWASESEPTSTPGAVVTLIEGSSFCNSAPGGDITSDGTMGVYFRDTRILSHWELTVDGDHPEPLSSMVPEPFRATFVGRIPRRSGRTDTNLVVERDRRVGNGMREDLTIHNYGAEAAAVTVTLALAADFADLFEVKEGRVALRGTRRADVSDERLRLEHHMSNSQRATIVEARGGRLEAPWGADAAAGTIHYDVVIPPHGAWSTSLLARAVVDGEEVEVAFPLDRPDFESVPAVRRQRWLDTTPVATSGHEGVQQVLRRSQQDLGALRIFQRDDPTFAAVAAGAPWFMALFGRDSLLTAYLALWLDQNLALGTLRTLAQHQGEVSDPLTEEQPGRILHETRLGVESGLSLGGQSTYYGTVDATPLFVVVLGELTRWGVDEADVRELLPHADRALAWVDEFGDRDGDGFVEYQRATDRGLRNQGWKDSWDGITFADGAVAEAPIALCEVQGYVYDALRSRARCARDLGDADLAQRLDDRADSLKVAFNERFWLPDRGWYALALDRDKRPVDACASNMGHCLWSGIVDADKAPSVAAHLMSPEMFTGWGIRTLSSAMGAYDPVSYHNGSVWPHDNALIVAGLMRYGFVEEARRIATGLFDAAMAFDGRLPELFCGFDRGTYSEPVAYPTSCSPQAWASATPIQLIRSLMQLEPWLDRGYVAMDPVLPSEYLPLHVDGMALGSARVDVQVTADGATIANMPAGIEVRHVRGQSA